MPVTEVSPGRFRWGEHGAIYRSRAKAEAQGRAILATGWRENGARHRAHAALSPSRKAELAYTHALLNIIGAVHRGVMHVVHREHLGIPAELHERIVRSTRDDVVSVARKLARPERLNVVAVGMLRGGEGKRLKGAVRAFAPVG